MRLQTTGSVPRVPEELVVGRSDPAYMAHGYLTKVPVPAIVPFIEAYTEPGDVVLDLFAGSGMTGVAAAVTGRRARLSDISVLGRHIGTNYVNLVDPDLLRKLAKEVVQATQDELGDLYGVLCSRCGNRADLVKTVWSMVVACGSCRRPVVYYDAMEAADWNKPAMRCPHCAAPVSSRLDRVGEQAVLDSIQCSCTSNQIEQPPTPGHQPDLSDIDHPHVEITPDRVMYKAQSLGKSGLTTVASYYTPRNLAVLTALHRHVTGVDDPALRGKLLFAFTASLTRASKRYQWSRQRPLNAANANYYVAAVFYEWNVYDLFLRKAEAAARSDEWIRSERRSRVLFDEQAEVDAAYEMRSAEHLDLPDDSVDYVFTDPPFGSNLFYADMALFQEAWLSGFTDVTQEAVVARGADRKTSTLRYERLLTAALAECRRVLKPGGRVSMVFGNSTGSVWSLVQRSIAAAGLRIEPEELVVLNKGQRSVKGLASGFEHVATLDLIVTMTARDGPAPVLHPAPDVAEATRAVIAEQTSATPSHLYLALLRKGMQESWDLATIDLRTVTRTLLGEGWEVNGRTGKLHKPELPVARAATGGAI